MNERLKGTECERRFRFGRTCGGLEPGNFINKFRK